MDNKSTSQPPITPEDQTPQPPLESPSQPRIQQKVSFFRKYWLPIGIVAVIVTALLLLLLRLGKNAASKQGTAGGAAAAREGGFGGQIAKNDPSAVTAVTLTSLLYLQSMQRKDGFYNYISRYNNQCIPKNGQSVCPFNGQQVFQTTNSWTMLGYLAGYKMQNNPKYLQLAKADFASLNTWCAANRNQCLWILDQPVRLYSETKDPAILTFLNQEADLLTKTPPNTQYMLLTIEARELALVSEITHNTQYMQEAIKRFDLAQNTFKQQVPLYYVTGPHFPQFGCWYWLAGIDIGRQNNPQILQAVKQSMATYDLTKDYDGFINPVEIQPCIESYFEMAQVTNDKSYNDTGKKLMAFFMNTFYDGKQQKKIYGEGGTIFMARPIAMGAGTEHYILTSDSAYTLYLLYLLKGTG